VELAKEASALVGTIFKDPDAEEDGVEEYNRRVIRIVYPEHCQYMYSCAMYLIIAKMWESVLPLIIGLRVVGNKLPINKCCCRYLWGVVIFTEGRESILSVTTPDDLNKIWRDQNEEIIALVAADMHQEPRIWDSIWTKTDSRTLDISSTDGDIEMETMEEISISEDSARESSDVRSGPSVKASAITSLESESSPVDFNTRLSLRHRWSGEDETWESMITYIRVKISEEKAKRMEVEQPSNQDEDPNKDAIQRRMSISNFL